MAERDGSGLLGWRPSLPGPWGYVLDRAGIPFFPLELTYRLSQPFADSCYALLPKMRENARRNYSAILNRSPDDPLVERMVHECFRQFGKYVAEMVHLQGWDRETLLGRLEVEGEEHFEEAEAFGKGVIFVSGHMGSTEMAGSLAVLKGFKITAVAERMRPDFLMAWAEATRARMGIEMVPVRAAGIKLLRALRRGEMVAMVVDAGVDYSSIPVTFFGRPTLFPTGPARLARLSGAPVVFGLGARLPHGRFRAHIEPPLRSDRSLPDDKDVAQLTRAIAATFERYIRRYPEQWYVFRDIWGTANPS